MQEARTGDTSNLNTTLTVSRQHKIILLSENHLWHEAIAAVFNVEPVHVSRTQLLGSDWLQQQQRLLRDATLLMIELTPLRTQSGTRNDRRLNTRLMHWTNAAQGLGVPFVMYAPKQCNAWQLNEIHHTASLPGTSMSWHMWCPYGVSHLSSGKPLGHCTQICSSFPISGRPCECAPGTIHDHCRAQDRQNAMIEWRPLS